VPTRLLPRGRPAERDDHVDAYPDEIVLTRDGGEVAIGVGWPSRSLRSEVDRTIKAGGELYSSPEPDPSESGAFMMISAVSMFGDRPDDRQQYLRRYSRLAVAVEVAVLVSQQGMDVFTPTAVAMPRCGLTLDIPVLRT
jgi:hypothetical protein